MQNQILSGLRSFATARLITQLLSWAGTVIVVRHLDSSSLGLASLTLALLGYASLVFDGGLAEALVQRPPESPAERHAVFTLLLGGSILLAALLAAAATPLAALLQAPELAPMLAVAAVSLVLSALAALPYAQLARGMAFRRLAVIDSIQAAVSTLASVTLALSGAGAWSLVLGFVAGLAVRVVALHVSAPGIAVLTFQWRSALRYLRFGGLVFADAVLWQAFTTADTLLIGRISGTATLGYFRVGQEVANLALEKISTLVNQITLPAYAELGRDRKAVAGFSLESMRTYAAIGFPAFWGLASVADQLLPLLFGGRWQQGVFPLIAFAVVAPLRLIGSIESPAMTGTGQPQVLVRMKLWLAPIMIVALATGVKLAGSDGACWVWMLVFPPVYLLVFRQVLTAIDLDYGQVWLAVRGALVAALVMVLVLRTSGLLLQNLDLPDVLRLASTIVIGMATYLLALRVLARDTLDLTLARGRQLLGFGSAAS